MSEEKTQPLAKIEEEKDTRAELFQGNQWELPTDIDLIGPAEQEFRKRLTESGWGEDAADDMLIAFSEALWNAVLHGNLDIQKMDVQEDKRKIARERQGSTAKKIFITLAITPSEVRIVIHDEGKGFDWQHVADPTKGEGLLKQSGRGILMMKMGFEEIHYNDAGNEITLIRRR